ncbi:MAG: acyl-CoA dehydrogenase family protein [Brasilonema angustatum HA4187-MV1]|nr:acyl-CoA dehydrogenase family protein [Brasilonema angustatum HA4187-MV1]
MTAQLSKDVVIQECHRSSIAEALTHAVEIADYCAANAAAIDNNGAFPESEFKRIAKAGLLAAPLQPELGGWGAGIDANVTYESLMLLKQMGRGNLAVGRVYEGHVNALQLIQTFGTREQIASYACDARDRHKIFGVWNAQASDGVKIIPLDNGKYRLEGSKTFCSGSGYVERPFVNGTLPDGSWQMFIVPMDQVTTLSDPNWWQPSGMRATASYKVNFSGVELEESSLIAKPGDYFRQPWLSAGVVRFAAVQLGGAQALFDLTRQYLQKMEYTNDPYQKERLGRMAIAIESGHLWLRGAADMVAAYAPIFGGHPSVNNPQADQLVAYANMVRTTIEQICIDMMQICERCIGTRGLLPPNPMERIIRDLTLYLRQPAFDAALANVGQYVLAETHPAHLLWNNE